MPAHPPHKKPFRTADIEVHVACIDQLFNSIDPSPFLARDVDPVAHEYIVDSSKALPKDAQLRLLVHLDQAPGDQTQLTLVDKAIRTHFEAHARITRLQLAELFRRGRTSLMIGLSFLTLSMVFVEFSKSAIPAGNMTAILRESLLIGGWVAMWRPMEIFLYDWWPVMARIRNFDRLANMPVRIVCKRSVP